MKRILTAMTIAALLIPAAALANDNANTAVSDKVIAQQNAALNKATKGMGFGPQSPRDLSSKKGSNTRAFGTAPDYDEMNLCNIHFHENAEHKGGEFTKYAGNGDGHGYNSGYMYTGKLTEAELKPVAKNVCSTEHTSLEPGDTIELHYVYSSAKVKPGPTLGACLSESIQNPQLRVETQVLVVVNDPKAADFGKITKYAMKKGYYQATNMLSNTGDPIEYEGSTTGPSYNEKASPLQVSWSVRPKVAKVDIASVGKWCEGNVFDEDHGHGVRNLVTNPELLSEID